MVHGAKDLVEFFLNREQFSTAAGASCPDPPLPSSILSLQVSADSLSFKALFEQTLAFKGT